MSISILLAEKIAQLFLILLMGYLVVRVGLLKPEDSRVLSVIMVYLVMPCMILNAFQIDNTPEVRTGIAYSFVVAGIMHLLFLALTALLKKPLKLDVIERCAVIYSNASALVIPLLQATLAASMWCIPAGSSLCSWCCCGPIAARCCGATRALT